MGVASLLRPASAQTRAQDGGQLRGSYRQVSRLSGSSMNAQLVTEQLWAIFQSVLTGKLSGGFQIRVIVSGVGGF